MESAQAGTLESMDCLVTVTRAQPGAGRKVTVSGAAAKRFTSAIVKKVNETVNGLAVAPQMPDAEIAVQDNGALDIVLGARVEAACERFVKGGGVS